MTTRRELLGSSAAALAGLALVGCGLVPGAAAQPAPRRREVVVNGKRIRTIDCHAHCHVPEALALMGLKETYPALEVSAVRIKAMDEQGIDVEALSITQSSGIRPRATWHRRSSSCRTRNLLRSARSTRTALLAWARWRCSAPTLPPSSSKTRSSGWDYAAR